MNLKNIFLTALNQQEKNQMIQENLIMERMQQPQNNIKIKNLLS